MALPTITYGLLTKYVHVAARLRGEAAGALTGMLSTGVAGAQLLTETVGDALAVPRGAGPSAYATQAAADAAGGFSVTA